MFIGYPGSCHDANVWRNSPLGKSLSSGAIKLPRNGHLLADSAYPIASYMMVPYKDNGHLTAEQKRFNYYLSSCRVCIEQTFGILKKKFAILEYIDVRNFKIIKFIVAACAVLHNFIINHDENNNQITCCDTEPGLQSIAETEPEDYEADVHTEGNSKRENLTTSFAA